MGTSADVHYPQMPEIRAPYSLHPSFAHWKAMLQSLESRTGKDLKQWLAALKKANASTPKEIRAYLASQQLGASTVGLILDSALGKSPDKYDPQALVDQLFKGPKAALLPIYETVLQFAFALGSDVKACPCATMVPLYRVHVFAQLKPSTKTRLDLGLAIGSAKGTAACRQTSKELASPDPEGLQTAESATRGRIGPLGGTLDTVSVLRVSLKELQSSTAEADRLIDTGGLAKKDRITHRLELTALSDFNAFAKDWLRQAYCADAR